LWAVIPFASGTKPNWSVAIYARARGPAMAEPPWTPLHRRVIDALVMARKHGLVLGEPTADTRAYVLRCPLCTADLALPGRLGAELRLSTVMPNPMRVIEQIDDFILTHTH
jgi:hypothetical protein